MSKYIRVVAAPLFGGLLVFASVVGAQAQTRTPAPPPAPAAAQGQMPNETAEQNVKQSQQYEKLLCSNPGFRAKRIAQECGPITDPQMHQNCEASFQCGVGSKAPNWRKAPPSETVR